MTDDDVLALVRLPDDLAQTLLKALKQHFSHTTQLERLRAAAKVRNAAHEAMMDLIRHDRP